jgi:hypothetical protein
LPHGPGGGVGRAMPMQNAGHAGRPWRRSGGVGTFCVHP